MYLITLQHVGKVMVDPELYHREHSIPKGWMPGSDLETPGGRHMREFARFTTKASPDEHEPLDVANFSVDFCFLLNDWTHG